MRRAAAVTAAVIAAAALAACGSDDDGDTTSASGATGTAGPVVGERMEDITPAGIDPRPQGFVSSDVLSPLGNAWRAGGTEGFTEVDAGSLATDRKVGALAIFRHDFLTAGQSSNLVEVRDAEGPLRITNAPQGPDVVDSAQGNGEIEFVGRDGTRGTLHLSDDSVTIDGG
jgi:hypothetical protein